MSKLNKLRSTIDDQYSSTTVTIQGINRWPIKQYYSNYSRYKIEQLKVSRFLGLFVFWGEIWKFPRVLKTIEIDTSTFFHLEKSLYLLQGVQWMLLDDLFDEKQDISDALFCVSTYRLKIDYWNNE